MSNYNENDPSQESASGSSVIEVDFGDPYFSLPDDNRVWVPDGDYQAVFVEHFVGRFFGCYKVALSFRIVDPGKHFGSIVDRWYNIIGPKGKRTGRNTPFIPPLRGQFARDYTRLCGGFARRDRVSMSRFEKGLYTITVETVGHDHVQQTYDKQDLYSAIRDIKLA